MKSVFYSVILFALAMPGWAQNIKSPSVIKPASLDTELHADLWCNIPGTLDDTCITNAIAALPSTGGIVVLSSGNYSLAHTITIAAPLKVYLRGQGARMTQSGGATEAATHLTWTGSTGGTMISILGTSTLEADFDEVTDMDIDCGGTAGVGLLSTNTFTNSYLRLSVRECTVADIEFTTIDGTDAANKNDLVDTVFLKNDATTGGKEGIGIWFTGTTGSSYANTNLSTFRNIVQWFGYDAPCIKISTGDSLTFEHITCWAGGGATSGILLGDPAQAGAVVLENTFRDIDPGPKGFVQQAGHSGGPPLWGRVSQTMIYNYITENGEPLPVVSSGSLFHISGLVDENNIIMSTGTGALYASGSPSINAGFGTGASVISSNGTAAFQINVGTGGSASSGTIQFPVPAATAWNCTCTDITTASPTVFLCKQAPGTTTTLSIIANYNTSGVTAAWQSGDILNVSCWGR